MTSLRSHKVTSYSLPKAFQCAVRKTVSNSKSNVCRATNRSYNHRIKGIISYHQDQDVPSPSRTAATVPSHRGAGATEVDAETDRARHGSDPARCAAAPLSVPATQRCSSAAAICHLTTWRGRYVSAMIDFQLKSDRYRFVVAATPSGWHQHRLSPFLVDRPFPYGEVR